MANPVYDAWNRYIVYLKKQSRRLTMPYDPKMYAILCSAASEAIDRIGSGDSAGAVNLLQNALSEAEDLYICAEDERKKE
jgi:hypothetical protein